MAAVLSLGAYLELAAATPPGWGTFDCLLYPAGWVRLVTGLDPAAGWRGRYRTAIGAARLLRREGGLLAIARQGMTGFAETAHAVRGDVGVVRLETADGPRAVGGVCAGAMWSAIHQGGLYVGPAEPVAVWAVGKDGR